MMDSPGFKPPESSNKYPFWKRLISSNWWWYGAVNPTELPPLDKRPKLWRLDFILVVAGLFIGVLVPTVVSDLNGSIPAEKDLQTVIGEVVEVHKLSPHLRIKTAEGIFINAEFPMAIGYIGFESRIFFDRDHRNLIKNNPKIEIKGQYLKFIPTQRFRIWALDCVAQCYPASYRQTSNEWVEYQKNRFWGYWIFLSVFTVFLIASIYRERKNHGIKN